MPDRQPHDTLFKEIFSSPANAASHLQAVLPKALVERIDWSGLRVLPTHFLLEELDTGDSDLLLSARLDGREALIYVLFEHQSTPDGLMAFRMLRYVVGVWNEHLKTHPDAKRLPPVIPCVLYHGRSPWKAATDCLELVDVDAPTREVLGSLLPSMAFHLDDLRALSSVQLEQRMASAIVRLTLVSLRDFATAADPIAEVERLADLLSEVLAAESGPQALVTVLCYLLRVNVPDPEELQKVLREKLGPRGQEAFMSTADVLTRESRAEGAAAKAAEILLKLLTLRFGPLPEPAADRVRTATLSQLDEWTERILSAESLDEALG